MAPRWEPKDLDLESIEDDQSTCTPSLRHGQAQVREDQPSWNILDSQCLDTDQDPKPRKISPLLEAMKAFVPAHQDQPNEDPTGWNDRVAAIFTVCMKLAERVHETQPTVVSKDGRDAWPRMILDASRILSAVYEVFLSDSPSNGQSSLYCRTKILRSAVPSDVPHERNEFCRAIMSMATTDFFLHELQRHLSAEDTPFLEMRQSALDADLWTSLIQRCTKLVEDLVIHDDQASHFSLTSMAEIVNSQTGD